jgi:dephospho-CoA kinase
MIVLGLTGSIGMGKSTVAKMFAEEGAPAFDSDAAVHELYSPGGAAVAPVEAAFPGVTQDGAIDRAALSAKVVRPSAPPEHKLWSSISRCCSNRPARRRWTRSWSSQRRSTCSARVCWGGRG